MADVELLEQHELELGSQQESPNGQMTFVSALRVLRGYVHVILLTVVSAAIAFVIASVAFILLKPAQRSSVLGMRLDFPGAATGMYPNGVRFSGSDIIDAAILREVFEANQLGRFIPFNEFASSVVVLEANRALEQLALEYESKLANPKISPMERERFEAEYAQKRESLSKNEYSIVFTTREGLTRVPNSVASKVLYDILRVWADFAGNTRQVLLYRVPLISEEAISKEPIVDNRFLQPLLALRQQADELQKNIKELEALPGAEVIRASKSGSSLRELQLTLSRIERNSIEYLIATVIEEGLLDRTRAIDLVEAELAYNQRQLAASEERVRVMRSAFEDYVRTKSVEAVKGTEPPAPAGGEVVPQLSDTFLDQVVSMAQDQADREYRQKSVDAIRGSAMLVIPLRSAVEYNLQLLQMLRAAGAQNGNEAAAQRIQTEYTALVTTMRTIAADLNDIRRILSRSLTASGQMYTVTSPPVVSIERSVSAFRLALTGLLVIVLTALIASAAALLHNRLMRSET